MDIVVLWKWIGGEWRERDITILPSYANIDPNGF
jgi:hypothetical protein